MHLARMYDTSGLPGSFSLEKLSNTYHDEMIKIRDEYIQYCINNNNDKDKYEKHFKNYKSYNESKLIKIDMKTLFSHKKILKNGEEGKTWIMPELVELHTTENYFKDWVRYSVLDAEVVFYLRDVFQKFLQSLPTKSLTHNNPISKNVKNNYEYYLKYWKHFGELLTDMEREGIKIDIEYLKKIELQAETDLKLYENEFLDWVNSINPNLKGFNVASTQQMQQLLFAPCYVKLHNQNKEKYKGCEIFSEAQIEKIQSDFIYDVKSNEDENITNNEEFNGNISEDDEYFEEDFNDVKQNQKDKYEKNEKIKSINKKENSIEDFDFNFISKKIKNEVIDLKEIYANYNNSLNMILNKDIKNKKFSTKIEKNQYVEVLPKTRIFRIDNIDVRFIKIEYSK